MKLSFGKIEISAGSDPASLEPATSSPFRLLVLGDFSGRASRGVVEPIASRKPIRIDRDNFDALPGTLKTELHLPLAGGVHLPISFTEVDDFHPDRLYQRLDEFQALRDLRGRLGNPATFQKAADQLRRVRDAAPPTPAEQAPTPPPADAGNLLEQMLGGTARPATAPAPGGLDAFLRSAVAPHRVSQSEMQTQAELIELVDLSTSGQMRAILHHPLYQGLESAWKALQLLVRRLDSDGPLQLFVLDVSKEELAADLTASEDLTGSGLYQVLVERAIKVPGGQPWAVLAGCYRFGDTVADAQLLGRLAQIAQQAGGPLLAAATPALAGCRSFADSADPRDWKQELSGEVRDAWQALRQLPAARSVGLIAPRFLLRLPYGKETDPIESFPFEEMSSADHEAFLWGPPALAVACLLGRAYNRQGWSMRPDTVTEIDNLPLHAIEGDMLPCAETWLTTRGGEALAERGIMALLSVKGSPTVQLQHFQSLAEPRQPLAGRWGR